MENPSRVAVYNLSAVLRETGLKADLVRAWERRYNLPNPQRSGGGHRQYSTYDIEILKWLKARQVEGLSISSAVELWRSLIAQGRDPLAGSPILPTGLTQAIDENGNNMDTLRLHWLEACMQFNSVRADNVLNQAFALYPVEAVCTGILQRGLSEIGTGWYTDRVSVQQEHFASSLAIRRVDTLVSMTPLPSRSQSILIGCPPGEWHTFPVLLLDLFLRRRGWRVINLGADIPVDQIVTSTLSINPDLIIMAAQTIVSAAGLQQAFFALRAAGKPLAYGGLVFNRVPALRERIPAYFLGEDLVAGIDSIEKLLQGSGDKPAEFSPGGDYLDLIERFNQKRTGIELDLINQAKEAGLPFYLLNEANTYFGNALIAALSLGDPAFIRADLEWIKNMLAGRQIPSDRLFPFLTAYRNAVYKYLGEEGLPITAILDSYISANITTTQVHFL
jgi:DNA-binding transcriptional MerR regulator